MDTPVMVSNGYQNTYMARGCQGLIMETPFLKEVGFCVLEKVK
jgi:hypothetical protein